MAALMSGRIRRVCCARLQAGFLRDFDDAAAGRHSPVRLKKRATPPRRLEIWRCGRRRPALTCPAQSAVWWRRRFSTYQRCPRSYLCDPKVTSERTEPDGGLNCIIRPGCMVLRGVSSYVLVIIAEWSPRVQHATSPFRTAEKSFYKFRQINVEYSRIPFGSMHSQSIKQEIAHCIQTELLFRNG